MFLKNEVKASSAPIEPHSLVTSTTLSLLNWRFPIGLMILLVIHTYQNSAPFTLLPVSSTLYSLRSVARTTSLFIPRRTGILPNIISPGFLGETWAETVVAGTVHLPRMAPILKRQNP